MEEVSFRSGAAALGGVLAAAGAAITLAVVLGGPGDAVASAPALRRAPLGGVRVAGARLLLAAGHPAAQPDERPRDRGRRLPAAAVPGPGIGRPARRDDAGARSRPSAASV